MLILELVPELREHYATDAVIAARQLVSNSTEQAVIQARRC